MADMTTLVRLQRGSMKLAGHAGDEASSTMIGDSITAMEKGLWMLQACITM
jgi:DNA-binding ferritin-like protein